LEGNPTPTAKILGSQGLHQDRESYTQPTTEKWVISSSILSSGTVSNPDVSESSSKKDVRTASNPAYVQSMASEDIDGQHLLVREENISTETNLLNIISFNPNVVHILIVLEKKATKTVPSLRTSPDTYKAMTQDTLNIEPSMP